MAQEVRGTALEAPEEAQEEIPEAPVEAQEEVPEAPEETQEEIPEAPEETQEEVPVEVLEAVLAAAPAVSREDQALKAVLLQI